MKLNAENLEAELTKAGYLYAIKDVETYISDLTSIINKKRKKVVYYLLYTDGKILETVLRKFGFKVETISFLDSGIKYIAYQVTATM